MRRFLWISTVALCGLAIAPWARAQRLPTSHLESIYKDARGKKLSAPEGVACGKGGTIVVADTGNRRLLRYRFANGQVTGGAALKLPKVKYPVRVHVTSQGEILALDQRSQKIARISKKGAFDRFISFSGLSGDDPVPTAFALDANDGIYVVDSAENRVIAAKLDGKVERTIALPEGTGIISDVAVAGNGTVYAFAGSKSVLYQAGKDATAFTAIDAKLGKALRFVTHLALTPRRSTLIAVDQHDSKLVLLGLDGSVLGKRLGMGWRNGYVYYPAQVCVTPKGELVVADRGNDRVQIFGARK